MNYLKSVFTPNEPHGTRSVMMILAGWVTVWLTFWTLTRPIIFPSPWDVIAAFPGLWLQNGLGQEMISSFLSNIEALIFSILIAFPLAYIVRVAAFRPLALALSKLRFLSPIVFYTIGISFCEGGQVKILLLVMGEVFFLVTSMIDIVEAIPNYQYDDARTLRHTEWESIYYVVIRGTLAQAFDAIRANAAMGWSMLMMVEGAVRSGGGVGVMLLDNQKHVNFAEIYAIAIAIVLVGIGQDMLLNQMKLALCRWVKQ